MFRFEMRIVSRYQAATKTFGSAAGALAYRMGIDLKDPDGNIKRYSNKSDVAETCIIAKHDWAKDPQKLAGEIDKRDNKTNSQLFRESFMSFDRRIPRELQAELMQRMIKEHIDPTGRYAVAGAIHRPDAIDGKANDHAHVMWSERECRADGLADRKDRSTLAEKKAELKAWRQAWCDMQNHVLKDLGYEPDLTAEKTRDRNAQDKADRPEPKAGAAYHRTRKRRRRGQKAHPRDQARMKEIFEIRASRKSRQKPQERRTVAPRSQTTRDAPKHASTARKTAVAATQAAQIITVDNSRRSAASRNIIAGIASGRAAGGGGGAGGDPFIESLSARIAQLSSELSSANAERRSAIIAEIRRIKEQIKSRQLALKAKNPVTLRQNE